MQFNRCFGCMKEIKGYPCPHCGFDPRANSASNYVLPYGTVLNGHYVVGKVLGQGGFGITYIGYDLNLERKVAIKEFYPKGQAMRMATLSAQLQWGDDAASQDVRTTGMDSFLREARKMAKVEDIPEVVGVRECFRENDTAYIIMDYIEGRTLLSVLKEKGPITWAQAKDIFIPAIPGYGHAAYVLLLREPEKTGSFKLEYRQGWGYGLDVPGVQPADGS